MELVLPTVRVPVRSGRRLRFAATLLLALLPSVLRAGDVSSPILGARSVRGPMPLLELHGTPAERGEAEGYLFAAEIGAVFEGYALALLPAPALWNLRVRPAVQSRLGFRDSTRERARGVIAGMARRAAQDDRPYLRIAGLGRDLDDVDLLCCTALPDWTGLLCSSFVVTGELLAEGEGPLVGRNLDYVGTPVLLDHTMLKIEAAGEGTHGFVSIGFPGMIGCLTGFSDAGVSVAIHDVPVARPAGDERRNARPDAFAALLETLDPDATDDPGATAAEILRRFRYVTGGNCMLGWSGARSTGGAVLEIDPVDSREGGVSLRDAKGAAWIVCTNHHRERASPSPCERFDALDQGCRLVAESEKEPLDFEAAWALLDRASVPATLHRCLADLENGRLRVQYRRSSGEFAEALEVDLRREIGAAAAATTEGGTKAREVLPGAAADGGR